MASIGFNGDVEAESRYRLLLVDPYGHSREGLGAALRADGLLVETAEGASQAVAAMRSGEVDLAIVDLDLPPAHGLAEDGWDLVHLLRAASPTLLLILIVAESRPHTQAEALRLGARLLEKPINPRELRTIVRAVRPETAPA
ncbi:MAG TPA: response regulator [Methylomirabilota bacterium]|jgi:DNA-binding response OmpR family regulator|nr:response regulator [Methylomirabilota bacterium]